MIETFDTFAEAHAEAVRIADDWPRAEAMPLEALTGNGFDAGRFAVALTPAYHAPGARCNAPKRHDDVCEFVAPLVALTDGRVERLAY